MKLFQVDIAILPCLVNNEVIQFAGLLLGLNELCEHLILITRGRNDGHLHPLLSDPV